MNRCLAKLLVAGTLVFQFAPPLLAQEEPLSLHLNARTRSGETRFFQGMPIYITVSLLNAEVRRAQEQAKERWRQEARQAEKEGRMPPPMPSQMEAPSGMEIRVADDNVEWLSRVMLSVYRLADMPQAIFQEVDWTERRVFPESVRERDVVLGKDPVWVTLEISPDMSASMPAGQYHIVASYPQAVADTFLIAVRPAETEPEVAVKNYELAEFQLRKNEFDKAIEFAQQAIGKLQFDHDMLYLTLGDAYLGKGQLGEAIEAYERFLATYEGSQVWGYPRFVRQKVEQLKQKIKSGR